MTSENQGIVSLIKKRIEQSRMAMSLVDVGTITEISSGIARISGLKTARYDELLEFPGEILGIAFNLEEDSVSAMILGPYTSLKEGDEVRCTGHIAEVPAGDVLMGRIIDPLGRPLDEKGEIESSIARPLEKTAPNVAVRKSVDTPVQTGLKVIDGLIPIGRGQRQLIIGDRSTGKTAITIDTIINQKNENMICIYVAIGQKASKVARVINTLRRYDAMKHTIIVAANAADSVALQYLAPYAGCAIGEEFMEQGRDCLVIYDDLSKHAWAYRQLSLLLRRPPGREAYPGDVFYLHSRLLERAARLNDEHGGGSLTALPIIETQAGDMSAYIPTNVISITDGQIYLETDLFNSGQRPAVNVGLSVSRVGSSAQTKAIRKVAGRLRLELAQYRELASFTQFGTSELDQATRDTLRRGEKVTEVLKQRQYNPLPMEQQVLILYAAVNGFLDNIENEEVPAFESDFFEFIEKNHPEIITVLTDEKDISQTTETFIRTAIGNFKKQKYRRA